MTLFFRSICAVAFTFFASLASASAADKAPFSVQVTGHGAPMLLIPGLASSGAVFDSTVAHFKAHFECHVLTLAGFAGVPPESGPFVDAQEAAISAYISAHHWVNPVVVGHSLGGFLALKLASDHPGLVGRLIILDSLPAFGAIQNPAITPQQLAAISTGIRAQMDSATAEQFRAQSHENIAGMVTSPENAALVDAWGDVSDRATVTNAMVELFASDLRGQLGKIEAPTLVLGSWIAYKKYTTRETVAASYALQYANLRGVKIEMAETARHFLMLDDPAWTFERMDAFLQATTDKARPS